MATLTTLKTRLTNRLKDISDVSNDVLYQIATDLNQFFYRKMFSVDPERFIATQSYSVSTSPSSQALPASFRDVQEKGCGFFIQNQDGSAGEERLTLTGYGSTLEGYYLNGSNVVFTGINSSKTIILRYIPTLTDISSLSDSFVVPDEFKELILEGLVLYYYRYNEDPREGEQDMRFARLLNDFLATLPKNPRVFYLNSNLSV